MIRVIVVFFMWFNTVYQRKINKYRSTIQEVTFYIVSNLFIAFSDLQQVVKLKLDEKFHLHPYISIYEIKTLTLQLKVILKMRRKEQLNSIIEICPVRNVVARFGNKWALLVILVISENEPIRYNELGRKIPDISSRVLSNTLRILEADGLINRQFYQEVPPRVEYSLTETGLSLVPIIIKLTEWAQNNMKTIIEHRNKKGN